MGFFSWLCKGCRQSIRSVYDVGEQWAYMVVAVKPDGDVVKGAYDGYGRVNDVDLVDSDAAFWHEACWRHAGSPGWEGPSKSDPSQGLNKPVKPNFEVTDASQQEPAH